MLITKLLRCIAVTAMPVLIAACSNDGDRQLESDTPTSELGTTVTLDSGQITGKESQRAAAWEWLGVPYARAPVDELRWKAPQAPVSRSESLATTEFAPECPHVDFFGAFVGEEDCLYLNVWRPVGQQRDLPVMVWVHGGGNNTGSANWPVYNGARLAEQANIVVVTIQYRLGPLGWLYYRPLQTGDANDNSGNFGTLDIIASLQWVQDNISAFGGSPDAVTVAGESAGGANILSLLISSQASGLMQQAIVQSAGGSVTPTDEAAAAAAVLAGELLAQDGLPDMGLSDAEMAEYLHQKSAEEIIRNNPGTPAIFNDGHVLPVAGFELFDSGNFSNKVPLLIGTNKDEFKLYTNPLGYNQFPDASEELRAALGRYVSDLWRVTGADSIATRLRSLDDYPDIYVYRFNWGSPDAQGNSPLPKEPLDFGETGGAHHGAEIPFMLGNQDTFLIESEIYNSLLYTMENAASRDTMAAIMVDYWGGFVRQGNPNTGNHTTWHPWSNVEGAFKAIVLDVNYADNQPRISEDYEVWTVDTVLADVNANVMEPLLSELKPYLERWLD